MMPLWLAVLMTLLIIPAQSAAAQRVVSLNLCADQLAMAYARPGQLAGVSFNAANPAFSARYKQARHYPLLRGEAEEIMALEPDLVLLAEGQNPALQAWLRDHQIDVLTLPHPASLDDLTHQQAMVRDALGASGTVQPSLPVQPTPVLNGARVAVYYPNGFSDGAASLMHELIERAGGINIAAERGVRHLSLEAMVEAQPDVLLVQHHGFKTQTQAEAMLHHPALQQLSARRVAVPGAWLICPQLHGADLLATIESGGQS